jgi:hypothetical protein
MKKLLAALIIASCLSQPAHALEGGVSLDVYNNADGAPVQPTWITGKVFSNDDMMLYSFYRIHPFKKEWRWEIPKKGTTNFKLKPAIVQHWKGYKPEGECMVTCVPMGEGKFRFYHAARADGPHGYLERTGTNDKGYPRYRFWFEDNETVSGSANDGAGAEADKNSSDPKSESAGAKETDE